MLNDVKERSRIPLPLILILLGIDALAGALAALRLTGLPDFFLLAISYLCQLLTFGAQFLGVGAALHFLTVRDRKHSFLCLLLAAGGQLLTLLIAGVTESFLYLGFDFANALLSQILSAIVNAIFYLAVYTVLLACAYLLCLRRAIPCDAPPPLFGRHPVVLASVLISSVVLAAKLTLQIWDTVIFIDTYWPSIYASETVTLVLDYVFLLVSAVIGHLIACTAASWLFSDGEEEL